MPYCLVSRTPYRTSGFRRKRRKLTMSGTVHPISIAAQRHTKIGFETQVGSVSRNCAITPSRVSRSTTFPNIQRTSRASQPKPITINVNAFARIPRVYQMRAKAKDWANSPISSLLKNPPFTCNFNLRELV